LGGRAAAPAPRTPLRLLRLPLLLAGTLSLVDGPLAFLLGAVALPRLGSTLLLPDPLAPSRT
jgi:hypothetical protein